MIRDLVLSKIPAGRTIANSDEFRLAFCSASGNLRGLCRHDGFVRDIRITTDSIRLGQFLKLADAVDIGSDVKDLLAGGAVRVNGELETRRGRQLLRGDVVTVDDVAVRVG